MDPRALLNFLSVAEPLKGWGRHCVTTNGQTESVAAHSWRLALMAMLVRDEFPEADIDKVIQMCLIHDLGEAVKGDIPTFLKTQKDETEENGTVAGLIAPLPEPYAAQMTALFEEMEAQESIEARLYKALDKIEAVIQHNEVPISTWLPLEYGLQMNHGVKECAFHPYLTALREEILRDTVNKVRNEAPEHLSEIIKE